MSHFYTSQKKQSAIQHGYDKSALSDHWLTSENAISMSSMATTNCKMMSLHLHNPIGFWLAATSHLRECNQHVQHGHVVSKTQEKREVGRQGGQQTLQDLSYVHIIRMICTHSQNNPQQ